jgi:hypothetical protein
MVSVLRRPVPQHPSGVEPLRAALTGLEKKICGTAPTAYALHVWPSGEFFIAAIPFEHRETMYRFLNFKLRLDVPAGGDPLVLTQQDAGVVIEFASQVNLATSAVD